MKDLRVCRSARRKAGRCRRSIGEPDTPVVEVLSADKVYANGTRALHPVDLAIRPGEFVTRSGPSLRK